MAPAGVVIAEASDRQWPLAMALLPELLGCSQVPSLLWVAHQAGQPQRLLAAGGLVTVPRGRRRSGFRALLRVLPAFRRQGLGRALLAQLAAQLRGWDLTHLHSWTAYGPGPTEDFLKACGFEPLRLVHYFHADRAACAPALFAWIARLHARRPPPQGLRLRPLADVPQAPVARLYAGHFGLSVAAAERHLAPRLARPEIAALSVALMDEREPLPRLAGFLLADVQAGQPQVDLWLVAPQWRNGTEALHLLEAFTRQWLAAGYAGASFHCHDETSATLGVARRVGAKQTGLKRSYTLSVAAQGSNAAMNRQPTP